MLSVIVFLPAAAALILLAVPGRLPGRVFTGTWIGVSAADLALVTDDYSVGLTQPSTGRRILDITLLALLGLGGAAAVARTIQRRRRAVQEAAEGGPGA